MFHLFFLFLGSVGAWGLSAPWIHLNSLLKSSIGADACVKVGNYEDENSRITITACDADVAEGLATVLKPQYEAGRAVQVVVVDQKGNVIAPATDPGKDALTTVQTHLNNALGGNRYFGGFVPGKGFVQLYVKVSKKVIQFWDDNVGDPYGNSNYTTQDVFGQLLNDAYFGNIHIGVTTDRELGKGAASSR